MMPRHEAVKELADLYREGLHDLRPYWSMDDGHVNPLDDPEVQSAVLRFTNDELDLLALITTNAESWSWDAESQWHSILTKIGARLFTPNPHQDSAEATDG